MRYCSTAGLRARSHIEGGNGIIDLSENKCLSPELGGGSDVFLSYQQTSR